jgi:hypothetical protein
VDSVVVDFSKIDTAYIKFGTIQIKIGNVHSKFSEKIKIDPVYFFSTRQIFKHHCHCREQAPLCVARSISVTASAESQLTPTSRNVVEHTAFFVRQEAATER